MHFEGCRNWIGTQSISPIDHARWLWANGVFLWPNGYHVWLVTLVSQDSGVRCATRPSAPCQLYQKIPQNSRHKIFTCKSQAAEHLNSPIFFFPRCDLTPRNISVTMTLILELKVQQPSVQNCRASFVKAHRHGAAIAGPSPYDLFCIHAVKSHLSQKIPSSDHLYLLTFPFPGPMILAQQLCDVTSSAQNGSNSSLTGGITAHSSDRQGLF